MAAVLAWMIDNKEWLFSGAVFVIVRAIIVTVRRRRGNQLRITIETRSDYISNFYHPCEDTNKCESTQALPQCEIDIHQTLHLLCTSPLSHKLSILENLVIILLRKIW